MKKSLLALAVLGTFAGAASAQSSVTLFGTIDLNARYVKNDGSARRVSLSQDGINSSQLGFRGVEDLGGGLKASFVLLSGINADTGSTNSKFFNRRSTVSLSGGFGEVRLGRDYTPTFWSTTNFDAFGTNGIGDSSTIKQIQASNYVRADNAVQYLLPSNLGGAYGQFMVAAAEGTNAGRYLGGRVGFAAGPFDIAVAYATERVSGTLAGTAAGGSAGFNREYGLGGTTAATAVSIPSSFSNQNYKTLNVGGSYDFGVFKLLGYYNRETIFNLKDNYGSVSVVVPVGQGEIHAGADYSKLSGAVDNTNKKFALGYVYNLSKRTALYGTAAYVDNGNSAQTTLGSAGSSTSGSGNSGSATALPTLGGKSKGAEVGVRHFF